MTEKDLAHSGVDRPVGLGSGSLGGSVVPRGFATLRAFDDVPGPEARSRIAQGPSLRRYLVDDPLSRREIFPVLAHAHNLARQGFRPDLGTTVALSSWRRPRAPSRRLGSSDTYHSRVRVISCTTCLAALHPDLPTRPPPATFGGVGAQACSFLREGGSPSVNKIGKRRRPVPTGMSPVRRVSSSHCGTRVGSPSLRGRGGEGPTRKTPSNRCYISGVEGLPAISS